MEIPNRFVVPAMVMNYCNVDGSPTERYFAYYEAKARGGWGLIITEDYAIEPRGKGYTHIPGLWEDSQVKLHAELPERAHKYGSKIFAQIYHAGRQTNSLITGTYPVAPSPIPCPTKKEVPYVLTITEIGSLVKKFGDTALRARQAGFDGVEIHGAHGYLVAQFMSAYSNKRGDSYGGSLTNRMRFPLEIISEIRNRAGKDYPIIFRLSGDEFVPGGRTIEETKAIAMILEEAGVDAIHVSAGVYGSRHTIAPPSRMPHAWIAGHAAEVKKVVSIPVITVGWINDPFIAESLLASGKADLVAMGRASLADPDLPNKAMSGKFDDIIYCIGCLQGCAERIRKQGQAAGCMLNPLTGNEKVMAVLPAEKKKKVLVAGGGVAGAEAAIIAAKRGHVVSLYEKETSLGGRFALAAIAPGKGEFSGFISWQQKQLAQAGVQVNLGSALTREKVIAEKPDVIIVATGSRPVVPEFTAKSDIPVITADEVLLSKAAVGEKVAIVGGGMVGAETANYLASLEKEVILLEMSSHIASDMESNTRFLLLRDLEQRKVRILTGVTVTRVAEKGVFYTRGNGEEYIGPVDIVVVACGAEPVNLLSEVLQKKGFHVVTVGDAASPRKALEAIEEGYRAALEIG